MKHIIYTILGFCIGLCARAQAINPVLSAGNHATLDSVKVSYLTASTGIVNTSTIYVKADIIVKLKPLASTDKIYLQVLNKQDSSVIYSVNYALSAATAGGEGGSLFFGQNQRFHMICPTAVPLNTYLYRVYTQSAQGTNSSTFITRQ